MHRTTLLSLIVAVCIVAVAAAHARQPVLRTGVFSAGATPGASSDHRLQSTLGQGAVGRASSSRFVLDAGFWHQVHVEILPLAADDTASTDEDTPVSLHVLANDTNPTGGPLALIAFSQPEHGAVNQTADTTLTYTPDDDFFGDDAFAYIVTNTQGGTAQATVSLTVHPVNDAPRFTTEPDTNAVAGQPYRYTAEATDVEGEAVTLAARTVPAWLAFADRGDGTATLDGTPTNAQVGAHAVALQAGDGQAASEQTFTVTVTQGRPAGPLLLAPKDSAANVPDSVQLIWQAVPGATAYDVQVATTEDFTALLVDAAGLTDTTFTVSDLAVGTTFYWHARAVNDAGASAYAAAFRFTTATGVAVEAEETVPTRFVLEQNYPNPFTGTTQIGFAVPEASRVRLVVYEVTGQAVATLVDADLSPGHYRVAWDGGGVASGVYVYRLEAEGFMQTRTLTRLR